MIVANLLSLRVEKSILSHTCYDTGLWVLGFSKKIAVFEVIRAKLLRTYNSHNELGLPEKYGRQSFQPYMFIKISRFWPVLVVVSTPVWISINIKYVILNLIFQRKIAVLLLLCWRLCDGSEQTSSGMWRYGNDYLLDFLMNKSIFVRVVSRLWMEFCLLDSWGPPNVRGTTWFADTDADSWCRIEFCFHWKYVYISCINVRVLDTCIVPITFNIQW